MVAAQPSSLCPGPPASLTGALLLAGPPASLPPTEAGVGSTVPGLGFPQHQPSMEERRLLEDGRFWAPTRCHGLCHPHPAAAGWEGPPCRH